MGRAGGTNNTGKKLIIQNGTVDLSASSSATTLAIADANGVTSEIGEVDVTGGTLKTAGILNINSGATAATGSGTLSISSGTVNTSTAGTIQFGTAAAYTGGTATLTQTGGTSSTWAPAG